MRPRFSVTIPAYNAASTIEETIESVLAQTFQDWELVVCDDGSTDATKDIVEAFAEKDARIRLVSQENRGSGGAYNTAMRSASSDLLVMLSADDLLLPEHMASFDRFIDEHADASIFSCNGYYEYDDGRRELSQLHTKWGDAAACTLTDLLGACFFGIGTVLRREVFDAVGGFDEDIYAEDYVFWLHAMSLGFKHAFLNEPLSVHRRNYVQKSADALKMRQADVRAINEVMSTGRLTPQEMSAAKRVVLRHQVNIAVRRVLGALMGYEASTRLINRLRGHHGASEGDE